MAAEQTFVRAYPDEECGCPVEDWIIGGLECSLHFEPDGSVEAFIDAGDWDLNLPLAGRAMDEGRAQLVAWIEGLPKT